MSLPEWRVSPTPEFIRSSRTYEKKHPDELAQPLPTSSNATSETRLYAYPHDESFTLHLLLIGDKATQRRDLRNVRAILRNLPLDPSHG